MIVTIDVGTTAMKGALFTPHGKLVTKGERTLGILSFPDPLRWEANPHKWLKILASLLCELTADSPDVDCLVISGSGPTIVPTDEEGQPLHNALLWMDRRSRKQAHAIGEISRKEPDASFYLPKILWFRDNHRDLYERSAWFHSLPGFLNAYLTGQNSIVFPGTFFEDWFWTEDMLRRLGIDREKIPPFIAPGKSIGPIKTEHLKELGLRTPPLVIAGGPDFVTSILGTGTVVPGRLCDRAGTSEGINLCTEHPVKHTQLMSFGHVIPGFYNLSGMLATTGGAIEWIKKIVGHQETPHLRFYEMAQEVAPGAESLLFLPHLAGNRTSYEWTIGGGAFLGLTLQHSPMAMVQAVIESVGLAIRDLIESMERVTQYTIAAIRVSGRSARTRYLNQMKADITQKEVWVPEIAEAELVGGAILAMVNRGVFPSLGEAADNVVRFTEVFAPREEWKDLYDDRFQIYKNANASLVDIFKSLTHRSS